MLWFIDTDLGGGRSVSEPKCARETISFPSRSRRHHIIDPTNPRGALDDGVEDRLHVRRRAADDAEHLGRCRLMLQGLAQFCVALLEFFEQPHVLDGDHRLIGEGFEQRDLFIGERSEPRIGEAEWRRSATPSRSNGTARAVRVPVTCWTGLGFRILGIEQRQNIINVNRLAVDNGSAGRCASTERPAALRHGHRPVRSHMFKDVAIDPID